MGTRERSRLRILFLTFGGVALLAGVAVLAVGSWGWALGVFALGFLSLATGLSTKPVSRVSATVDPKSQERLLRMQPSAEDIDRLNLDQRETDEFRNHP